MDALAFCGGDGGAPVASLGAVVASSYGLEGYAAGLADATVVVVAEVCDGGERLEEAGVCHVWVLDAAEALDLPCEDFCGGHLAMDSLGPTPSHDGVADDDAAAGAFKALAVADEKHGLFCVGVVAEDAG